MSQQDMTWETFSAIIDRLSKRHPHCTVSLQGEGEPSLHPLFWRMVDYVVASGHTPYSILNGSRVEAARIASTFPRIGISLDTLDADTAERIGRHNLPKVLSNLEELVAAMGPARITVMSVDLGQPLAPLRAWVRTTANDRRTTEDCVATEERDNSIATRIHDTGS